MDSNYFRYRVLGTRGGSTVMTYLINGDEVTAETYDRDRTDNLNCGIAFTETQTASTLSMEYTEV